MHTHMLITAIALHISQNDSPSISILIGLFPIFSVRFTYIFHSLPFNKSDIICFELCQVDELFKLLYLDNLRRLTCRESALSPQFATYNNHSSIAINITVYNSFYN